MTVTYTEGMVDEIELTEEFRQFAVPMVYQVRNLLIKTLKENERTPTEQAEDEIKVIKLATNSEKLPVQFTESYKLVRKVITENHYDVQSILEDGELELITEYLDAYLA